jgi:adenylate kinase family enzyme
MHVAIIGYSGAGSTTLANALAGVFGTPPIRALEDLWGPLGGTEPLVLDGFPNSLDELVLIDTTAPQGRGIEHLIYLMASEEVRLERVSRMVVAGANPAHARDRMLDPADLERVVHRAGSTARLTMIDASRSRSEVLLDALDALGIAT